MAQLRRDYLLNRYVIIAQERAKRPQQFVQPSAEPSSADQCPFCPGNEKLLPGILEEVAAKGGGWLARAVPNKFTAVSEEGDPSISFADPFHIKGVALGRHEVVIDTSEHGVEFEDLAYSHLEAVLRFYARRLRAVEDDPHVRYTALFKNKGPQAGASISHAHAQIIGLNLFPPDVSQLFSAAYQYHLKHERCPYDDIIAREKHSRRLIFINPSFVAIAPFASQLPFEALVLPLRHVPSLDALRSHEYIDLAHILRRLLRRLSALGGVSYNLVFLNDEPQGLFRFQIRLLPRLNVQAGFEQQTGVLINPIAPEDAARFYREAD